jgi:hypothetical protein
LEAGDSTYFPPFRQPASEAVPVSERKIQRQLPNTADYEATRNVEVGQSTIKGRIKRIGKK